MAVEAVEKPLAWQMALAMLDVLASYAACLCGFANERSGMHSCLHCFLHHPDCAPVTVTCNVCRHCPEFTLTYPEYDPTTKRDDAVARVEREGEEGDGPQPLPEAHADEPAAGRTAANAGTCVIHLSGCIGRTFELF